MKAIDIIKENIPNPKNQEGVRLVKMLEDGEWYHIHRDEEVPEGHIQLRAEDGWYIDLYEDGERR